MTKARERKYRKLVKKANRELFRDTDNPRWKRGTGRLLRDLAKPDSQVPRKEAE